MMYKDRIISSVADKACKAIANRVIRHLCTLNDALLSGDDSSLENTWDEICVQVQGEYSIFWDLYEEKIEGIIEAEIEKEDRAVLSSIWLQTYDGIKWTCDDENETKREALYFLPDLVSYVFHEYVMQYTMEWSNKRIRAYLTKQSS